MAVRVPWDKYEAAILLDACLNVEQGKMTRSNAITYVSTTLRNRAVNKGMEIDDKFRNENGISMQFSAMTNCLHHKSGGLTISKVFYETVMLYELNTGAFRELVQAAKELNPEKTGKISFAAWLKMQAGLKTSADTVINSLSAISALCLKEGATKEPIIKMNSSEKVNSLLDVLRENKKPHIHSKKKLQIYIYAISIYLKYLAQTESQEEPADEKISQKESSITKVNFVNPKGFAYTRPDYFQFSGSEKVLVKNWTKLYVGIVNELCERNPGLLEAFVGKNINSATRIDVLRAEDSERMTAPYFLKNGLVIETNLSATDIVKKIRTLLDLCEIPYEQLLVVYHKRDKGLEASDKESQSDPMPLWEPKYSEQVAQILVNYYSYGFRTESPIEIMRFRNYAEQDAIAIPESDEELYKEIKVAGNLIDGKIFVIDNNSLLELVELVSAVFESGTEVIFLEPFAEKNAEWLEEHFITSSDMIKDILAPKCPQFYYGQNIITSGEKRTEHDAVVSEIHRISSECNVIYFTELCKNLPYIPADKIAWSLSASDDFVWISEGKYFVMDAFIIDDVETVSIQNFVASECDKKGYASIADLPFGDIPEQNYELSTTALYAAVYIAVLKKKYKLKGKILTRDRNDVDIVSLLKAYCQKKTNCTVAEVMSQSVDLVGVQNRQYSFVALYETKIRINKEEFVSDSQVQFDVDQIDELLQNIIEDRFAPIKSITTFALFPPCGQSWNHYLLESYCYRFSKRYQLYVLNYNNKNVGIIASKTLNMSYIDMLCESAAKADISLTQKDVGQYFFDRGLTAKRKFASLPRLIEKAAILRGEG